MQTVLIAGGAGFIGSNLTEALLKKNYKVICLDNLITGEKGNTEDFLDNSNYSFIEKDITGDISIGEKIDFIFHLASPASPNVKNSRSYMAFPVETLMANSLGTYNLLELAKKNNAKFLFASSSEIYGNPEVSPQVETYVGSVSPNGPRSVYDEAKRFGESMTFAYLRKFKLDVKIVRIFNTYGPKMRADDGRVVSNFINQALKNEPITIYGDGKQTRSFCFVDDMVSGLEKTMFSEKTQGEVLNLGNPDEKTILEFAEIIIRLTSSSSKMQFEDLPQDDPYRRKPDINKAKSLISWEPRVSLEEGIKKTIEFFK